MQHKRLISALAKVGATITNPHTRRFRAEKNGKVVVWYTQEKWDDPSTLTATCVHAPHPDTNASVDLFMDTYFRNIKSAAHYLT